MRNMYDYEKERLKQDKMYNGRSGSIHEASSGGGTAKLAVLLLVIYVFASEAVIYALYRYGLPMSEFAKYKMAALVLVGLAFVMAVSAWLKGEKTAYTYAALGISLFVLAQAALSIALNYLYTYTGI